MIVELLKIWAPFILLVFIWLFFILWARKRQQYKKDINEINLKENEGSVTICRNNDPTNVLRKYKVIIDGAVVGDIGSGEIAHYPISPGLHEVQVKIDWCTSKPLRINKSSEENILLECGATYNDYRCIYKWMVNPSEYVYVKNHA